jgi:hypothetical protein
MNKKLKKLFSKKDIELLQETLQSKDKSINLENNAFQYDLFLLKKEREKKYNEIILWFRNEYNKLVIKHNQKMREIDLQ